MKLFGKFAVVALLGLLLLSSRSADASIDTTIGGWESAVTLQDTGVDKIWTFISSTLNSATTIEIDNSGPSHSLTINSNFVGDNPLSSTAYTLRYKIAIDTTIEPDWVFSRVGIDSNVLQNGGPGVAAVVTKSIYTDNFTTLLDTIVSTNGSVDNTSTFTDLKLKELWIEETFFHNSTDNQIRGTTNTFNQAPVPEPASLAIWSLIAVGGAAVAASRRRRRGRWSDESRVAIRRVIERN
jgi:hypothetical protein